jgi:hypothetical protein
VTLKKINIKNSNLIILNKTQQLFLKLKKYASEEDQVSESGFYDIDQAFLETDPTAINTWHPTDSQILQAHSAGMTLQRIRRIHAPISER